jgi:hypothetical protein
MTWGLNGHQAETACAPEWAGDTNIPETILGDHWIKTEGLNQQHGNTMVFLMGI